jgi:hypothetical protein
MDAKKKLEEASYPCWMGHCRKARNFRRSASS